MSNSLWVRKHGNWSLILSLGWTPSQKIKLKLIDYGWRGKDYFWKKWILCQAYLLQIVKSWKRVLENVNHFGTVSCLTCGSQPVKPKKNYLNFTVTCRGDLAKKSDLRKLFKTEQSHFDKKFRFFKRQSKNKDLNELHKLASENSPNIWAKI